MLAQKSLFDTEVVSAGGADFEGMAKLRATGKVSSVPNNLGRLSARETELTQSGFLAQDVFMRQAKRYRKLKGLTVTQVAESILASGRAVTAKDLEHLENGTRYLKMAEAGWISEALGTTVEWLLGSGFSSDAPEEMKWPPNAEELEAEAKAVLRRLGEVGSQVLQAQQREQQAHREYEMASSMLRSVTTHQHEMERNYQYLLGRIDSLRAASGEPTIMETVPVYDDDPQRARKDDLEEPPI